MSNPEHRCMCGYVARDRQALIVHRQDCQLMRCAYLGDIRRVANMIGRTPTQQEYSSHRCKLLPGWSNCGDTIFLTWNDAIIETGLTPTRKTIGSEYAIIR